MALTLIATGCCSRTLVDATSELLHHKQASLGSNLPRYRREQDELAEAVRKARDILRELTNNE